MSIKLRWMKKTSKVSKASASLTKYFHLVVDLLNKRAKRAKENLPLCSLRTQMKLNKLTVYFWKLTWRSKEDGRTEQPMPQTRVKRVNRARFEGYFFSTRKAGKGSHDTSYNHESSLSYWKAWKQAKKRETRVRGLKSGDKQVNTIWVNFYRLKGSQWDNIWNCCIFEREGRDDVTRGEPRRIIHMKYGNKSFVSGVAWKGKRSHPKCLG